MPTLEEWRRYYDGWADADPSIASTGDRTGRSDFEHLAGTIASWAGLTGSEHALDVGCASGTLTSLWAPRAGAVAGIDFSERLIEQARVAHPAIEFLRAEAARLPFPDGTFDRVICFNVLLSLPDHDYAERAISEILRVAREKCRILLGSLPDVRCQQRFFEVLRAESPWPRRVLGRLKDAVRGGRPRRTSILWFDIEDLCRRLGREGFDVEVREDPPFSNYRHYRKSLLLARGCAMVAP